MKKKSLLIIALIIVMAVASLLVACSSREKPETEAERQTTGTVQIETSEETEAFDEEETEAEDQEDKTATESATKAVTEFTTKAATEPTTKNTAAAAKTTEPATKAAASEDKKAETKAPTKEAAKQSTKATTAVTKATEAKKVCYITVDGHCSGKQIELKGGESVYDVLKQTGANISARNTGYGVYVEGINGRFEFDEGPTSGWVYTVNGTRPSVSCSGYDVKSGDKIVWTYVTEV